MIAVEITLPLSYTDELIRRSAEEKLGFEYGGEIKILRRRLVNDEELYYKLRIGVTLDPYVEARFTKKGLALPCPSLTLNIKKANIPCRPVVVGSGPCGLFAALTLARSGACPIVIERGDDMDTRKKKVAEFEGGGALDPESNIQFGEGGAGTFSDGKLKHGAIDAHKHFVLSSFVSHGAPEEILYDAEPHVGTDLLCGIIKKLREEIISLGGEFRFGTRLYGLITKKGAVKGIKTLCKGVENELYTDILILAIGHSARDTFRMLDTEKVASEAHGFGIGVRIEHKREHINKMIYGEHAESLERAASYHFVTHLKNGRSVYSFCMCPGGSVVAATSNEGAVVTNGMSLHARNGENSHAAFLVSVTPEDFGNSPLKGLELQERLEGQAFSVSGDYKAPCLRMEDFIKSQASKTLGDVSPTYPRGTVLAKPCDFLPDFIEDSLRAAIPEFEEYKKGFYCPDALLTGIETRTTSPVRLLRGENRQSLSLAGLYPSGEGAGYAGGIISSAVDGLKTALSIIEAYQ